MFSRAEHSFLSVCLSFQLGKVVSALRDGFERDNIAVRNELARRQRFKRFQKIGCLMGGRLGGWFQVVTVHCGGGESCIPSCSVGGGR
ncbi:hypothetical protein DFH07DRAFT_862236 [Mycena maculata]|uniref:Uncharacterized protein n=1 Tax=Mycena maculata TaxID=230809 RepID=A0AAD7HAJ6_9AGAR|nr:hypothetical protein DFH07DRAFT_862236 [Mycena maculata]